MFDIILLPMLKLKKSFTKFLLVFSEDSINYNSPTTQKMALTAVSRVEFLKNYSETVSMCYIHFKTLFTIIPIIL